MNNLILVFILLLAGCGLKEKADDMADTSNQIHDDTSRMANGMADTKRALALDGTFTFGKKTLKELFDTSGESLQVGDAGAFIKGLYFQTWNGGYKEDLLELDDRLADSAEWLISQSRQYIPRDFWINSTLDPGKEFKGLSAIAAEMDRTEPAFDRAVAALGLKNVNLYQVVVDSLRQCNHKDPKYPFPSARKQICQMGAEYIYLLQLRHNYLPMLMLSQTTKFSDVWTIYRLNYKPETSLPPNEINIDSLELWTSWLNSAKATREVLNEMCIRPVINNKFAYYIDNLQLGPGFVPTHGGDPALSGAQSNLVNALANARNRNEFHAMNVPCRN